MASAHVSHPSVPAARSGPRHFLEATAGVSGTTDLYALRLEQLEYVLAVGEYGSFREAARELHVSKPALSTLTSRLERELGVTLLDRTRAGATVGDAGRCGTSQRGQRIVVACQALLNRRVCRGHIGRGRPVRASRPGEWRNRLISRGDCVALGARFTEYQHVSWLTALHADD
jgi:hypothetical protein